MKQIFGFVDQNRDRFLGELSTLLRQPSISALNQGVTECAELLKRQMEDIGIPAKILPTAGHPVVFGELKSPGAARTVLIYGHYDVQPPDPLDLWTTPPFEPTVRDGLLYARGATDDKGQVFTHIKSLETHSLQEEVGEARIVTVEVLYP